MSLAEISRGDPVPDKLSWAKQSRILSREPRVYTRVLNSELSGAKHRVDSRTQIRSPKSSLSQESRWAEPRVASRAKSRA